MKLLTNLLTGNAFTYCKTEQTLIYGTDWREKPTELRAEDGQECLAALS